MDGLVTGVLNDQNTTTETLESLANAGYQTVSVASNNTPATSGPLTGVTIPDIGEALMSYGADEAVGNNYCEEIGEDYFFIAVPVAEKDAASVQALLSNCNAKDIQFIHR